MIPFGSVHRRRLVTAVRGRATDHPRVPILIENIVGRVAGQRVGAPPSRSTRGSVVTHGQSVRAIVQGPTVIHAFAADTGGALFTAPFVTGSDSDCGIVSSGDTRDGDGGMWCVHDAGVLRRFPGLFRGRRLPGARSLRASVFLGRFAVPVRMFIQWDAGRPVSASSRNLPDRLLRQRMPSAWECLGQVKRRIPSVHPRTITLT